MIIVLLLFFKSICLYCQRLVLYIHDRWINPKNVRLLKEAAEAKGSKFKVEEYREVKKTKKRRYATTTTSSSTSALAESESCSFCANTPQGYCRHHFHLQELHIQKQQRQQKFWCPLSGVVNVVGNSGNRSNEYRQLRKIKRELKRNIQQQQQLKTAKISKVSINDHSSSKNSLTINTNTIPTTTSYPTSTTPTSYHPPLFTIDDSGYQTISGTTSTLGSEELSHLLLTVDSDPHEYIDIELPSPSASMVETTYSFETCCDSNRNTPSPIPQTMSSYNSFMSCEYTTLSTSYL